MNGNRPARVLSSLTHGGHALSEDLYKREPAATELESLSTVAEVVNDPKVASATDATTTRFDYMIADARDAYPAAHLPIQDPERVVSALTALGSAMVDGDPTIFSGADPNASNSTIPPIYTYWGQFIDHDITANTDRDDSVSITGRDLTPFPPDTVVQILRNLRQPALNLDSLYGDGPDAPASDTAVPYVGGLRLELGTLSSDGPEVPPLGDGARDLPRVGSIASADRTTPLPPATARVGDGRNDENLIVAQLHVAFLRFHNAVVDWVEANEPALTTTEQKFARARQLVTWHYQWLVAHDFLGRIATPALAQQVLDNPDDAVFRPLPGKSFMPLEFSVAAFRFGHSMVRAEYDHNRNFGRPEGGNSPTIARASFDLLFAFTGKPTPPFGDSGDGISLPHNWPIEWDRFVGTDPALTDRFARKIDTHLAPPLRRLANEGNDPLTPRRIVDIVKRLAVRNLLRGYRLGLPTGQAAAHAFGVTPLTPAQLRGEADAAGAPINRRARNQLLGDALADGGFLEDTPLWFYVLKEAELLRGGDALGPVGGRIVCETIVGQLRADADSYLNRSGGEWSPAEGVTGPGGQQLTTIKDLIRFAGLAVDGPA